MMHNLKHPILGTSNSPCSRTTIP